MVTLLIVVADATPNVGVVRDGDEANTKFPVPVLSDITPANSVPLVNAKTLSLLP
jgi:hypothetical protein